MSRTTTPNDSFEQLFYSQELYILIDKKDVYTGSIVAAGIDRLTNQYIILAYNLSEHFHHGDIVDHHMAPSLVVIIITQKSV